MWFRRVRPGFALVEMIVTLAIVSLIVFMGTSSFSKTRERQSEREFVQVVLALVERAKGRSMTGKGQITLRFEPHSVTYIDGEHHQYETRRYPTSLSMNGGGTLGFIHDKMIAPNTLILKSVSKHQYVLKPQLGWGVIHVTET